MAETPTTAIDFGRKMASNENSFVIAVMDTVPTVAAGDPSAEALFVHGSGYAAVTCHKHPGIGWSGGHRLWPSVPCTRTRRLHRTTAEWFRSTSN
ncbi:hypothetical protein GCM10023214_08520 [Amycolatopsis dongchuanensis]|uniref:Uncharacterized protein n=1 Tax=Amycolatopsis dongchuanensis TaxID=1070866 RepID=A0ABP9Q2L1_9PSEU